MRLRIGSARKSFEARKRELDIHDVINMQYTSGTTGFPKGRDADAL